MTMKGSRKIFYFKTKSQLSFVGDVVPVSAEELPKEPLQPMDPFTPKAPSRGNSKGFSCNAKVLRFLNMKR